jgi:alkaline phosphatase D
VVDRRELLRAGLALPVLGGAFAVGDGLTAGGSLRAATARSRPARPDLTKLPVHIAFGSCADQDKPQPIWEVVLASRPDLFVFLGDNIYGDTRDPAVLREKYARLAAQPGFRRLCAEVPILATWDDHDFGEDDAGADYPMKVASQEIFCDFWGEPAGSPRRRRDGIYDAVTFAAAGRRLQIILPDLRYNRTPLRKLDLGGMPYREWSKKLTEAGGEVPGPYERNPDSAASMLGEAQWRWLEAQLGEPADLRIFASSLQVVADFPGWEAWINYAEDHQRLLQTIRKQRADGLLCISGDTHYAEISRLDTNVPYPLWDITSSGLTEVWPVTPPNSRRRGGVLREANFGLLTIDWDSVRASVLAQAIDVTGKPRLEARIPLGSLSRA